MAKYRVYGFYTATKILGEYEAASKEEAIKKANEDPNADFYTSLCWQCSDEIELNDDPWKLDAEEA